jgi:hypothetical protein
MKNTKDLVKEHLWKNDRVNKLIGNVLLHSGDSNISLHIFYISSNGLSLHRDFKIIEGVISNIKNNLRKDYETK